MNNLANEVDDNCGVDGSSEEIITEIVRRKIKKFRKIKKIINYSVDEEEDVRDQSEIDSYSSNSLSEIIQNVMIVIPPVQLANETSTQHANTTVVDPNLKSVTCQFDEIHWPLASEKLKTCIINNQIIDSKDYVIVPQTRDDEVQSFAVVGNLEVKFLPQNIGELFANLEHFTATNSSIGLLEEETFAGLRKLKSLSLANNRLRAIIPETFNDLRELHELDLSHNRIATVDETLFQRLSKLKVLRLNDNEIHYLHPKLLKPLRNLQNISISNNHLTILDDNVFGKIRSLSHVWLSNNRLKSLTPMLFKSLPQLVYVDLTENKCIDDFYNQTRFDAMNDEISRKCANEYVLKKKTLSQLKKHDERIIQCSSVVEMFWDALHENLMTCLVDTNATTTTSIAEADVKFDSSHGSSVVAALLISENENIKFLPSNIAEIFPNLLVINADGGGIVELGVNTFQNLKRLRVLSLRSNNITNIAWNAFADLTELEHLDLSDNNIEEFEFNATTFRALLKLKTLSLAGNEFKNFHPQLVDGLAELEEISIDSVDNAFDVGVLFHSPKLRVVKIDGKVYDRNSIFASTSNDVECEISYGNDGNVACRLPPSASIDNGNSIRLRKLPEHLKVKQFIIEPNENVASLPENLSEVFPQLEEISITQTKLAHVDSRALKGLRHLKRLNLSQNKIESLSAEAFNELESLSMLNLSGNFISNITGSSFDYLTSMQKLCLTNNSISMLDENLFAKLRHLNVLKLDGNLLSVIGAKIFRNNPELIEIDLSRNALVEIEPDAFMQLRRVKTINLRWNKCIDGSFDDVMDEMLSSLKGKCTKKIARKVFLNCDDDGDGGDAEMKSCRIDQEIDRDNLPDEIAFHVNGATDEFSGLTSIEHLTLQGQKVKTLPTRLLHRFTGLTKLSVLNTETRNFEIDIFNGMSQLSEVKFSGNIITRITSTMFNRVDGEKDEEKFFSNLRVLDLTDNRIEAIELDSFESLTMLEKLSLSHNKIRSIHDKLFEKLRNLNEVRLDNNLLSIIEMKTFTNNRRLSEIDLTSNSIETLLLSPVVFDKLKQSSLRKIKLRGNKCIDEDFDLDNENESVDVILRTIADKCMVSSTTIAEQQHEDSVVCNEFNYEMKSCTIEQEDDIGTHETRLVELTEEKKGLPERADIEILRIHGGSLPQHLGKHFPNIRDLLIKNPSIDSLTREKFTNMEKLKMLRLEGITTTLPTDLFDELENLNGLEVVGSFEEFDGAAILMKLRQLKKLKIISKDLKTLRLSNNENAPNGLEELELQSAANSMPFPTEQIMKNNPQLRRAIVNGENVIDTIKSQISTPRQPSTKDRENSSDTVKCYFEHWLWEGDDNPLITCSINQATRWDSRTVIAPTSYDNHTRGLRIVNNKNLKFIPKNLSHLFPNLRRISLSNSSIESIAQYDFEGLKNVRSLDLSRNVISIVNSASFKQLNSLEELNLSDNQIVIVDEQLLNELKNLRVLNLKNNNLTSLKFLQMPNKLETLLIDGNQVANESILEVLQTHPSLRLFETNQGNGSSCSIEMVAWTYPKRTLLTCKIEGSLLDTNDFVHHNNDPNYHVEGFSVTDNEKVKFLPLHLGSLFPNLIVILASNNGIVRISHENFDVASKLKFFNLARNYIDHVDAETFAGLENLEDFDLSFNQIQELDESTFVHLKKLKSIYLSSNLLRNVPSKIFENQADLRNVSLENNRLRSIDRDLFVRNRALKNIWLNGNQIRIIDPRAFASLRADYIDLRENDCINNFFDENDLMNLKDNILHFCQNNIVEPAPPQQISQVSTTTLQQQNLLSCKIDEREATAPAEGKFFVCTIDNGPPPTADGDVRIDESPHDPLIQIIIFDNNKHLQTLPRNLGAQLPSLRVLSAKNSSLSSLHANNFTDMVNVKQLDLSHNGIVRIPTATFHQLPNLDDLLLSANLIESIEPNAFPPSLRVLRLNGNRLKTLNATMFAAVRHLQKLHLQSNQIERISPGVFDTNRYLDEVLLADNSIRVLSATAFDNLLNLRLVDLEENDCISGVFNTNSFKAMKHKIRMSCVEPLTPLHAASSHVSSSGHKVHPNEFVNEDLLRQEGAVISVSCELTSSFSLALDKFLETCTIGEPVYSSDTVVESSPNNRRVKRLALTNRESISLPSELANELPELEEVAATNLEIESISPGTFRNLSMLKSIIMFGNNIRRLQPEAFIDLPTLERLDLSNNQLKYFHDQNIYALRELNLASNQLRILTFDSFHLLPSLEHLNLNNNRIFLIESDAFSSNARLKRIILSNNEISRIELNAFSVRILDELELLDVSGNECINEIFENISHDDVQVKTIFERRCGSFASVRKSLVVCRRNVNSMRKLLSGGAAGVETKVEKLESDLRKSQAKVEMLNKHIRKFKSDHQREMVLGKQYENQLNMISMENVKLQERLKFCSESTSPRHHLIVKHEESSSSPFVEINCKFELETTRSGEVEEYSCEVVDFTSLHDNSTLDEVRGEHKRGKRNSDVSSLLISEQNVRYLPKGASRLLPNLRRVKIVDSNLRRIGVGEVAGDIVEIIITGNHIYSIETGSFDALERLEMLDLSNNAILEIPPKLFERTTKLVRVNLDSNNLRTLSSDILSTAANRIQVFVASHNKLREIDPNIVRQLRNALTIDFSANECTSSRAVDGTSDDKVRLLSEIILNCQRNADDAKDEWKFCKL